MKRKKEKKVVFCLVKRMFRAAENVRRVKSVAVLGPRKLALVCTVNSRFSRTGLTACVLVLVCISACQPSGSRRQVVTSDFMEFEDLFTPVDTVRFDASVLIGSRSFIDLSDNGEFLVTDDMSGVVHIFESSGRHIRTFGVERCNPEDGGRLLSARFLRNYGIIVTTDQGVYAFNADGSCKQRLLELPPNRPSFCERRDTVYFMYRDRPHRVHAYSIKSGTIQDYELQSPKFPRTNSIKMGYVGRQIACFDHGVFYRYSERSDGEPLWQGRHFVTHRPPSYRPPKRDLTSHGNDRGSESMQLAREFTYSNGIFELDQNHRMVTFQYPAEVNINIVNMNTQTSMGSTTTDMIVMLTKNGLLYVSGDYEQLPSGEVGNRTLEVWQFHPFDSSHTVVTE